MSVFGQEFLMPVGVFSAEHLRCSAERSALLAEAFRYSDRSPRSVRLQVYGESMLPALWPGDVVEIVSCSLEDIQPGDIVLALREGRLFLHRLTAANTSGFLLRGDSMPGCDPEYSAEALLGRLTDRRLTDGRSTDRRLAHRNNLSPASRLKVVWYRTVGFLLCHCGVVRRLALRLHARKRQSLLGELPGELPNVELL
jgi:hypothetical protein